MFINCKEASVWLVRLQDDELPAATRFKLKCHLLLCERCRAFNQQMSTLKMATTAWRDHIDEATH